MLLHHRRSIRLSGYDYSQPGSYFVTLCARGHASLFGDITNGEMVLNDVGEMVREEWIRSIDIRKEMNLDKWVIMPNHIHGVVVISPVGANGGSPINETITAVNANDVSPKTTDNTTRAHSHAPLRKPKFSLKPKTIGSFVAGFKSITTKRINQINKAPGRSIWQRNYYEHIIRDEHELNKIRRYIINNPPQWEYDRENHNGLPIDDKQKFWSKFLNEFE